MKDFLLAPCIKLRGFVLMLLALASLPVLGLAQGPSIAGLPETVTGTQAAVPFSGPAGPTYSTFTIGGPATGTLNSQTPNTLNVWCINPYAYIQPSAENYTAYSSYDPNLWAKGNAGTQTQWQEINWVLNNKTGHSGTLTPTIMDIQGVIWDILIPGYSTADLTASGAQLQSDAAQYGPGFAPIGGQWVGIVLYSAGINSNDGSTSVQDLLVPYLVPTTAQVPGLKITKTASETTAKCTDTVTYTYVVSNTGTTVLTNVTVVDDNATPNYPADDVTIASGVTLQPGQSQTYTRALLLPLAHVDSYGNCHMLIPQLLPNGDILFTLLEDTKLVDNTWGKGASPDWGSNGNSLGNHLGQDSAEFEFVDGAGNVVLDFAVDYASLANTYPSGIGTYGLGGAGHLYSGNPANIDYIGTTLTDNMNAGGNVGSWYTNSPPPGHNNWTFQCGYKVAVKQSCFGHNGYGGCHIKCIKHACSKQGTSFNCTPVPSCAPVTNTVTATASTVVNGATKTITASAQATVQLSDSRYCTPPPPPVCHCNCICCRLGLHCFCLNPCDNDASCKKLGCQQQPPATPAPCSQSRWSQLCWANFIQCGKTW